MTHTTATHQPIIVAVLDLNSMVARITAATTAMNFGSFGGRIAELN